MSSENLKKSEDRAKETKVQKVLLIIVIVVAIAVAAIVVVSKRDRTTPPDTAKVETEAEVYTPTFMYFVTTKDENYDEYMAVLEEVKSEYEGTVKFDVVDIDEESDAKDRFGDIIALGTPSLIMLNTHNDPCAFMGECVTKEQMTESIARATGNE